LNEILGKSERLEVRFIFIQTKTSEKFEGDEIGTFIFGVRAFFASEEYRPKTNQKIENLIAIKDKIYLKNIDFVKKPVLDMFYACCGNWNNGNNLQSRIDLDVLPLKESQDFENVNFYTYDNEKIITSYKELKKKISKSFKMEKKISFPDIAGVTQAYLGLVRCNEFVSILIDNEEQKNMLNNIFEDNVRDFQGYNSVNKEIQETISSDIEQAWFAILNNGITIVAHSIKVTGDTVEIFDYQIVNGCQSSYVLFENSNKLKDQAYIVIKIIEAKDEVVSDRVIYTTNRQTEVKSEAFTSTKKFHKYLQDYYNSIPPNRRLYYERRSKQYELVDNINKNKVVTLATQTSAYIAMFLNEPQSTHRYYGEILDAYKNKIYIDNDVCEPYYLSAYFLYYVEDAIRRSIIEKRYRTFKFHIICAMKILCVGSDVIFENNRKMKKRL
jgi:hypothetical protein